MPRNKFRSRFWFSLSSRALRYFYNWMQNSNEFRRVVSFILGSFHVFHFGRGDRERRPKKKQQRKAFRQQAIFFSESQIFLQFAVKSEKFQSHFFVGETLLKIPENFSKSFLLFCPQINKHATHNTKAARNVSLAMIVEYTFTHYVITPNATYF